MVVLLMLFVGAPASGKTYFAQCLMEGNVFHNEHKYRFVHVNLDELLPQADLKKAPRNQWKEDRHKVLQQVEQFVQLVADGNESPVDFPIWARERFVLSEQERLCVIIDDNMYYRSMRLSYYRLAQTYNCAFCQIYFETDLKSALDANRARVGIQKVPDSVVKNILKKIEPPNTSNAWERNSVTVNSAEDLSTRVARVLEMVELSFENPERVIEISKPHTQPSPFNVVHMADVILRRLVSQWVKERKEKNHRQDLPGYTKSLMESKSAFLSYLKNGKIQPPSNSDLERFIETAFESFFHLNSVGKNQ